MLRVNGPFPYYADLFPPPIGYRWAYLTCIYHNLFYLESGGRVAFPAPYLVKLPQVRELKWWEHQRRVDDMIEDDTRAQKPDKWVASSEPFLLPYPTIHQYCTDCWAKTLKGIVPRTPCTLSITFFSGAVNLTLNEKTRDRSCHTTAQTVLDALMLLEEHLAGGSAPWRYWKK